MTFGPVGDRRCERGNIMIISDDHRFAFVHIPKCAGTSVKRALRAIDTTGASFLRIGDHPQMGTIHFAHIPLRDLATYFPEAFGKVRDYQSIAIVRDPMERFFSAIFQRLREFRGFGQSEITPEVIEAEALVIQRYLEANPARLDLEHVHFNRQSDFIELDGEQVVSKVFAVDRMADVARFVAEATGVDIGEERRNRTTEMSLKSLRPIQQLVRRPYARLVSAKTRAEIRDSMTRMGFYKDVPKRRFVRPGSSIDTFVRSYYARDFALHQSNR